jgi:GPH family glycoside/pentoside/hexuronide:cation symporter
MLVLLFWTGAIPRDFDLWIIPVSTIIFLVFHDLYHVGATAAKTVAFSMMADVSEINRHRTGVLKDGSYSAMLSFVLKLSISVVAALVGFSLEWIGYDAGAEHQTPEVAARLMLLAFIGGSIAALLAMGVIALYPVDRAYMERLRDEAGGGQPVPVSATGG